MKRRSVIHRAVWRILTALVLSATASAGGAQSLAFGTQQVAAGGAHSCAITELGGVKCWGSNASGQLGDNTTTSRTTPVDVVGLSAGVATVVTADTHTCALMTTGSVRCWGANASGQLGDGTFVPHSTSVPVTALSAVTAISAAGNHTCALAAGGIKCWGANGSGELGDTTTTPRNAPVDVSGLTSGVAAIAAGSLHTCALTTVGGIKCWGANGNGQLGDSSVTPHSAAVDVSGLPSGMAAIAAGAAHTCALTAGGGVKCWGLNSSGQLGDSSTTQSTVPVNAVGLTNGVNVVAAGGNHSCAISLGGGLKCWGNNASGEIGDGSSVNRTAPVGVAGLAAGVAAVATGSSHSCALTARGDVKCWGANADGQLGDNTTTQRSAFIDVNTLTSEVNMIASGRGHSCLLTAAGGVKCWGGNGSGQLGNNTVVENHVPVDVVGLSADVAMIASGDAFNCALTTSGGVKCWGDNTNGQLGNNAIINSSVAVDVQGLSSGVAAIATGSAHVCALIAATGSVRCWGNNGSGQLGLDPVLVTQSTVPAAAIGGLNGVAAIAAGGGHNCTITPGIGVQCWGRNRNLELGVLVPPRGNIDSFTPLNVTGVPPTVIALALGSAHSCAIVPVSVTVPGGLLCWGDNTKGQIGIGTVGNPAPAQGIVTPTAVLGLSTVTLASVNAQDVHSCVVTTGGAAKCWGDNTKGQIGNGSETPNAPVSTPTDVTGLSTGVAMIAPGGQHTCALFNADVVKCWGFNQNGQIGDNTVGLPDRLTATTSVFGYAPRPVLSSSANPALLNQSVVYSATLADGTVPTGFAVFKANGVAITGCGGVGLVAGSASCNTSATTIGTRIVSVSYAGDTVHSRSLGALAASQIVVPATFTVTPSADANGSITPNTPQTVGQGLTASFSVTANVGYSATVGGTCGGNLVGTTYTTNAINADCSVSATFTINSYLVTPSAGANGSIAPSTAVSVNHGATTTFVVTANAGFAASVGGTCGGALVGTTYTTNAIIGPCTVVATFLDVTPPDTSITASPPALSNSANASFSFTATEAGSSFACQLDNGGFSVCVSPKTYAALAEGSHTFAVRATDAAGNTDATPATFTWIIDVTAPILAITSKPIISGANQGAYSIAGTCSENGRTVNAQIGSVSTTATCIAGTFTTTPVNVTVLAQGAVALMATTTDLAGNAGSSADSTSKDTINPTLNLNALAAISGANQSAYAISGTCSENGRDVTVSVTGSAIVTASPNPVCTAGSFSVTVNVSSLADGTLTVSASHSDAAGNATSVSAPVSKVTIYALSVTVAGSGGGSVSSTPAGINCPGVCSQLLNHGSVVTLTATASSGSSFVGWTGGGCAGTAACVITMTAATSVSATFQQRVLDIDNNGSYDAGSDALMVTRYLFGLTGAAISNGVVGGGALRIDPTLIQSYLTSVLPLLDIDGNGHADALTDGLLITRYQLGMRGAALIQGAIGPGATRTTAVAVEAYLRGLMP